MGGHVQDRVETAVAGVYPVPERDRSNGPVSRLGQHQRVGVQAQVHHALRIDLLDRPDIDRVIGTQEYVRGAFFPTIEPDLMIPHEVLAG
jgi:hypothetical protein